MKEVWKDIPGYKGLYQVSNLGNVIGLERKVVCGNKILRLKRKNLKPEVNNYGYNRVTLSKNGYTKRFFTHRLVADLFIKNNENKTIVNHINNIRDDNRAKNLEWVTTQENINHKTSQKRHAFGSRQAASKLHENDIPVIFKLRDGGMSYNGIADKYSVNKKTIIEVIKRRSWSHVNID